MTREINFDGLVGPTHNYAGLSHGNIASMSHRGLASNPRQAALQGLAKMRFLADLGVTQAVLPPHERPALWILRAAGFTGRDADVLAAAAKHAPPLLVACGSASNMWTANAATFTPSSDARDGRAHFTPANLISKFHRAIEPPQTARTLRAIFRDETRFVVHAPLPAHAAFADEGAANHTRFAPNHAAGGLHLFVHGHRAFPAGARPRAPAPKKFASRQSREAFEAIARCHLLDDKRVLHAAQSPAAIDAGVFHNDVISVGNENVFLYHEEAFARAPTVLADLRQRYRALTGEDLIVLRVPARAVPLRDAVKSYLFNSQLVTLAPGRMALIAPTDCHANRRVRTFIEHLLARADTPLREVHYVDLKQSMRNGGGPACLRLRVVLTDNELAAIAPRVCFTPELHAELIAWVRKHYRERLTARDLADPALLEESRRALDQLTQLLQLGSIYPFQLAGGT
jgi:succinylarginine dihydrolase